MTEDQVTQTGDQGATQTQTQTDPTSLGWRAGLPDNLKNHEAFTPYKTVGDLGKVHIEVAGKLKELEGQMAKINETHIPRLPENPTKEQVEAYYTAVGRPMKPEEYAFPKEEGQENSPEMVSWAQKTFFEAGLSRQQGELLAKQWNGFVKGLVEAEEAESQKMKADTEKAFKAEFKTDDEYKAGYELTKRFWKKITNTEFDEAYKEAEAWQVPMFMKFIFNVAKATGEDSSPPGSQTGATESSPGMIYDKTPQHRKR